MRLKQYTDRSEVFDLTPARSLVALLAAAAMVGWAPAARPETSISIGVYGGDHFGRGHFHGHAGRYRGHGYGYRPRGYPFGYPDYYGYGHYQPYWRPRYAERSFWYRGAPGPRCIYRYGYRYCR